VRATTRRAFLASGTAALGAAAGIPGIAGGAAALRLKCANIMPADHPLNVCLREAGERIRERTDGRVELAVYPASQLGNDADMLSQLRAGGIDLFAQSGLILSTLVPVAAISGIGFAFADYGKVWAAMDGALGKHVARAFEKVDLVAFDRVWDNGFRQILSIAKPIRTPDDLRGVKLRVPPSPLWTAMFKAFGAAPVSIPWGETYSALQNRVADGLENPLAGIYLARMHEVGRYLSTTRHMWDGFWIVANRRSLEALTPALRDIVTGAVNDAALAQRADLERLNVELKGRLTAAGIVFVEADPDAFRRKLQQSGFYAEWKTRMGPETWGLLEATAGKLA
jgi:TRAP-type transport system periplasmic protein